jgi:hypothetical protein
MTGKAAQLPNASNYLTLKNLCRRGARPFSHGELALGDAALLAPLPGCWVWARRTGGRPPLPLPTTGYHLPTLRVGAAGKSRAVADCLIYQQRFMNDHKDLGNGKGLNPWAILICTSGTRATVRS